MGGTTITIGVIIAAMAIGMCGLFSLRLPSFITNISPKHDSVPGSFGFGIMTAVLSTPCTAPFMGAAAAWAATQTPATTLATFSAIGAGMALPYLVLSALPNLVQKMPRSGPASVLIKEIMGLLLLAAAAYFVGTGLSALLVVAPDPPSTVYWWPVMGFSMAAGAWLTFRTIGITTSLSRRALFGSLGALLFLLSIYGGLQLTANDPVDWVYYTPDRFEEALKRGKVVVMDFTAEWCLNCKALEQSVLYSDKVVRELNSESVVAIKVDITGNNPDGKEMLRRADRLTIPYLVVYDPSGRKVFDGDFYSVDQVLRALDEARGETTDSGG